MLEILHDTWPLCTIDSAWPPRQAASSSSVQPVLNSKHCLTTTAMLLLKHKPFQCYLTIKSRKKISCELKERRFWFKGHLRRTLSTGRHISESSVEEDIWLFTNKMVRILSSLGLCERRTPQFNLHGKAWTKMERDMQEFFHQTQLKFFNNKWPSGC